MIRQHGEACRDRLEMLLCQWAGNPGMAGPYFCALPLLLHLAGRSDKGIQTIISATLPVVINGISQSRSHRSLCGRIGKVLETEVRGSLLQESRPLTLARMKRRLSVADIVAPSTLRSLHIRVECWTKVDRFQVGALLLDQFIQATKLVEVVQMNNGKRKWQEVRPTAETVAIINATPARELWPKRLPMVVPPREWEGPEGGGHLQNRRPLARRAPHLETAAIAPALEVVNTLQRTPLLVDPQMLAVQREAWQQNLAGLFPATRDPVLMPPAPQSRLDRREWLAHLNARAVALQDRRVNHPTRLRIERVLQAAAELTGGEMWQAYEMDHRGRIYTCNREVTHQGLDMEKALLLLPPQPCGEDGFQWLLRGAAGHWGIRGTWDERLQWGKDNLELLTGAAETPLDRVDLWRDAKDPWQFLQACLAVRQWLQDPSVPIGCPVRLDQHASGLAVSAALTRDGTLGALTRLTGNSPVDLYQHLADQVVEKLRMDLEAGPPHLQARARMWLEFGITRSLMKGPAMAGSYGQQFEGMMQALADALEASMAEPCDPAQYEQLLLRPAGYLARHVAEVLEMKLASANEVRAWIRQVGLICCKSQKRVEWTTPSGWPMSLGDTMELRSRVPTAVSGGARWERTRATLGELSARATNRSSPANLVHSFDAAFLHRVVGRAARQGMPLLPNHDCFAAAAGQAQQLHTLLHDELGETFRPNWLKRVHKEIQSRTGLELPQPPQRGTLRVGQIGQNPYAFS